jgi:hypothetical protein
LWLLVIFSAYALIGGTVSRRGLSKQKSRQQLVADARLAGKKMGGSMRF